MKYYAKTDIRSLAGNQPAVYFLFQGKTLVYIGRTQDVKSRLLNHIFKKAFSFSRFCFIVNREDYEQRLIKYFKPKFNGTQGKKPFKIYNLEAGKLATFKISEEFNIRYRARTEGWKIKIRKINGKLLVFREA